jgi:ArsR family transcriptional regulator, cadmium/lead-responsive transcriptional repressor
LSDEVGAVFAALADPTRRWMVQALLRERTTSVPRLAAELPISRQAVAKHIAALDEAGLLERRAGAGREVRYGLREGALSAARDWMLQAAGEWDERLGRLKTSVERAPRGPGS